MNIARLTLVVVLLLWNLALYGQSLPHSPNVVKNGKRDGAWTIWLNADWLPTSNKDSVEFYRRITYAAGKPVGLVSDHFRNGKPQWQGYLITDQPVDEIDGIATWYNDDGTKQEVARFEKGIKQESKIFFPDGSLDTLGTVEAQAIVLFDLGEFQKAAESFVGILPALEKILGSDNPEYATRLSFVGNAYVNAGNLKQAEVYSLKATAIRKKVFGEKHIAYASALNNLFVLYDEMGEFEKAEKLLNQALQIRRELGAKDINYAVALNNLGALAARLGRYEESEAAYRESLSIRKSQRQELTADYANTLNNLGSLLDQMGKPEKAEPLLLESARIYKIRLGEDHPDYAIVLVNLSNLYNRTGQDDKAEAQLKQALAIRREALGEDHPLYATSLASLGMFYADTKKYQQSESLNLEALRLRRKLLGADHPECANSLNNLGTLYIYTDRYHKAEQALIEALEIRKKKPGVRSPVYLNSVNNIAKVYQLQLRYKDSESLFLQNLKAIGETQGESDPLYLTGLFNLAALYQQTNDQDKAQFYYHAALDKFKDQIDRYFLAFSEKEKQQFYQQEFENFLNYHAFCLKRYAAHPAIAEEMFNTQLFTKGILLNSQTKWKDRILHSGDTALVTSYNKWIANQERIARLYQASDSASRATSEKLIEESQTLEKNLTQRSGLFASLADKRRYTWKDVQRKLKPGEAAIEMIRCYKYGMTRMVTDTSDVARPSYARYYQTDTVQYAVLIVTPSSTRPQLVIIENGSQLERRYLNFYRNCISTKTKDAISYSMFWKPIAMALDKKTKKVYFSPDGVYNSINLSTLFNPDTKRYLLDEMDIHRVTTTRDLPAATALSTKQNVACLVGHPNYQLITGKDSTVTSQPIDENTAASSRVQTLTDLPGTQTEMNQIGNLLKSTGWRTDIRTGDEAREEFLKSAVSPRVMHVATHGYFDADTDESSSVNPLLKSGLMLAGASRTLQGYSDEMSDDGILTAFEAMNLNLDNTDLVVLSACETGLGEVINGEGVYGLQRAFTVAGARSVIMSMWKVSDEATQEMLTTFYQQWLKTGKKSTALKQAQRSLKKKYPDPYYWGAFVIVGGIDE